MLKIINAKVVL